MRGDEKGKKQQQRKPMQEQGEHMKCHSDSNLSSGLNWRPRSCEAATLTAEENTDVANLLL